MRKIALILLAVACSAQAQVHPHLRAARDLGRLSATHPMDRMILVLQRSPQQEAALDQFLADQHDPNSPRYQQWLTPEQFGERFGASSADIEAVSSWLRGHGFVVHDLPAGRQHIEFSGVAAQVEHAFRTEMHHYDVAGERHVANATDITIPAAFRAVVHGVSLHDFRAQPMHHVISSITPDATSGTSHAMGPYDFATIYNMTGLWTAGTDGTGQNIAIAGRAVVPQSDYGGFRTYFGLPAATLQVITTSYSAASQSGGDLVEATLDVEWSGGVAKGATVTLVASTGTQTSDGVDLAISYVVNNNVAPILSISFGLCEAYEGSGNAFHSNTYKQAAAQGISVFVSTGDNGSAGCDWSSASSASGGLAVNGLASTPYNVAVGGTMFNDATGSWWNTGNTNQLTAKGYIPEVVWNESASGGLWAGSGGVSTIYATPSWQTGTGVPIVDPGTSSAHHRYLPDVSLSAAGHDPYLIIQGGGLGAVGGTSASAPSFAGIMALINQRTGSRNGLPLPRIYALASQTPAIFHDTTGGTNAVPCTSGTPNCVSGKLSAYAAGTGYDLATGWGSVDVNALVTNWSSASPLPAILTITPSPVVGSSSPQTITINGSGFQTGNGLQVIASYTNGTPVTLSGSSIIASSAAQIQVSINLGTTARTWSFQVVNPNSQASNTVTVAVSAPPPVITSLSPSSITGSNSAQTLTINGTGFQSGAGLIVIVGYQGAWTQYTGSQITSVSGTQIVLRVNFGTTARAWAAGVINPGGGAANTSNSFAFTVSGPVTPVITSVNPGTVTGSASAQTFTINGTGFQSGAGLIVIVGYQGAWTQYTGSQITSVSATQIVLPINFGLTTRAWAAGVISPSGATSNSFAFQVTAPAPVITSVNPSPVTGSNANQAFTINGTGFQSGAGLIVIVGYQGAWTQYTGSQITSVSATQIVLPVNFGVTARAWAAGVINPGGGAANTSNSLSFTVNAPVTPAITSVNPSPVTGSSSAQTFTIHGTGFVSGTGLIVIVGYQGAWTQYTASQITSVTATQIVLQVNFGTTARGWAAGVINPSGATSNSFAFAVH